MPEPLGFTTSIVAVCTGRARSVLRSRSVARQRAYRTAILKSPREESVWIGPLGLQDDEQVDRKHHGGPDQAVHAHFRGTAKIWAEILGWTPPPGFLGENLALLEGSEEQVCVGDLFQAGQAVLQVTCPRVPCATLADQLGYRDAVAVAVRKGCTGFYFRVRQPGRVAAGDSLVLLERRYPFASIAWINRLYYASQPPAASLAASLDIDALPAKWRRALQERLYAARSR